MTHHYYQIIVDRDATEADTAALAERALEWLADEQIVEAAPTPSVPSGLGRRPAEAWQSAIVEIDEYFLELDVNGVEAVCGRRVFDAGDFAVRPYCPRCNKPGAADARWRTAVEAWRAGDDAATLSCPHCGAHAPLVDWRHDPPIGFGNLGVVFWNWPSLNREFIEQLARVLGHRVVLVEGKTKR